MQAMLYDPDDYELVIRLGNLVCHALEGCKDCLAHFTDPEGREHIAQGIAYLDRNTSMDLSVDDLEGVMSFCEAWMNLHTSLRLLDIADEFDEDMLTVEIVNDTKH
jgi:hypothetical protein